MSATLTKIGMVSWKRHQIFVTEALRHQYWGEFGDSVTQVPGCSMLRHREASHMARLSRFA
jgi:hypothetical protein